ncbi:MAG: hypothetical protein U0Y68_23700 [Blastocatellia bacterium]
MHQFVDERIQPLSPWYETARSPGTHTWSSARLVYLAASRKNTADLNASVMYGLLAQELPQKQRLRHSQLRLGAKFFVYVSGYAFGSEEQKAEISARYG